MDRNRLIAMGIDYDSGLNRFAGKVSVYEKYLIQFTEDLNFPKLEDEMQREAYEEAFKTAHALKGVIGTLSISRLHGTVSELVEALRGKRIEEAKERMKKASEEYREVVWGIQERAKEQI